MLNIFLVVGDCEERISRPNLFGQGCVVECLK